MMKKLGLFILLLVAIGTGLSLYLPKYSTSASKPLVTVDTFTVVQETLETPIDINLLRPSIQLFDVSAKSDYALQLGVYGSLNDAIIGARQIDNKQLLLPELSIINAFDGKRHWYIVILGPIKESVTLTKWKTVLEDHNITYQDSVWPIVPAS